MKKATREFKGYVTGIWDDGLIIGQTKEYSLMDLRDKDKFKEMLENSVMGWVDKAFDELYEVKDMKSPKKAHIKVTIERLD